MLVNLFLHLLVQGIPGLGSLEPVWRSQVRGQMGVWGPFESLGGDCMRSIGDRSDLAAGEGLEGQICDPAAIVR